MDTTRIPITDRIRAATAPLLPGMEGDSGGTAESNR